MATQYKERAYEASHSYEERNGMVVAEETLVVTEHQQQVKPPEHHIELHKGYDAGVACHGLGGYHLTLCAENGLMVKCTPERGHNALFFIPLQVFIML